MFIFNTLCKLKTVKLAASVAMNSYHPYGDIQSPHPPSPDNNNYASSMSIGNTGAHHHNGHAQLMSSIGGQQQGFHQINNNNAMMNKCAGCGSKFHHYHYHYYYYHSIHLVVLVLKSSPMCLSICPSMEWLQNIYYHNIGKIAERFLLKAMDQYWHHTCLKCTCCGATLADLGTVCYTRGNMILCKADYSR